MSAMRLIYFSPVFAQSYSQRPHYMVRHFLEQGGVEVLWVNPYPTRLPRVSDLFRGGGLHDQQTAQPRQVRVLNIKAIPVEPVPVAIALNDRLFWRGAKRALRAFCGKGSCLLGIGIPSGLACWALEHLDCDASFYDAMDDFPEFHTGISKTHMAKTERKIIEAADSLFVSSWGLLDKFTDMGASPQRIANACDPSVLPEAGRIPARGKPVIGYLGTIGRWFDWQAVLALADRHEEIEIAITGPHFVPLPPKLPDNVKLYPPCRHDQISGYLSEFSAGLIPFRKNKLTHAVDPIKYYEYRAMGLPVLTTRFGDMSRRGADKGVFFLEEETAYSRLIREMGNGSRDMREIEDFRHNNGWLRRFQDAGLFRGVKYVA